VASPTPLPVSVYLDAGRGSVDSGGRGYTLDGQLVDEKTLVLQIAYRTQRSLAADCVWSVLPGTDDSLVGSQPGDFTADGPALTPDALLADSQRRILGWVLVIGLSDDPRDPVRRAQVVRNVEALEAKHAPTPPRQVIHPSAHHLANAHDDGIVTR
jgi:hypothetical protein